MDLVVQLEDRDGWAVARLSGDLDLTTSPRLREQVVLDLEAVDFVDSTGLGVLVGLLKRARTQGGDLRLVSTRTSFRKILELTALERALPLAASVDDAIAGSAG